MIQLLGETMKVSRAGEFAASRLPKIGEPVADRWQRHVDEPLIGRYRHCTLRLDRH